VNGLVATFDPRPTRRLLGDIAAGNTDVAAVTAWLDTRVTAADPSAGPCGTY
jgi:hypothetical protein